MNLIHEQKKPRLNRPGYSPINKDYRETLKNIQEKNAKELMIESLTNINDIILEITKALNENKLSSLSVTQRYTKELKYTLK